MEQTEDNILFNVKNINLSIGRGGSLQPDASHKKCMQVFHEQTTGARMKVITLSTMHKILLHSNWKRNCRHNIGLILRRSRLNKSVCKVYEVMN